MIVQLRVNVCKTEIIVCDTIRFALILKLARDSINGNLRFQMGRVFPSKRVNLPSLKESLVFIGLNWVNSYAINKCFVKKYASSVECRMHRNPMYSAI